LEQPPLTKRREKNEKRREMREMIKYSIAHEICQPNLE
jgi:hypothetical protein